MSFIRNPSGVLCAAAPPRGAGRLAVLALAVLAAAASTAAAQSEDEQSAYRALIYTPVAGLPPLPPVSNWSEQNGAAGITLTGRLGHMSRGGGLSLNGFGATVEMPRGKMRLGATLAYMSASCGVEWEGDSDCMGDIMLGGSVRTLLTTRQLGASPPPVKGRRASRASSEPTLLVGFDGSLGLSPRQGENALAIGVGIPTAVALQSGTVRIMPFITPGLGYGRLAHVAYFEDEPATARGTIVFLVGGGFGLEFGTSGIGANVGFQRVLKGYGGTTQLGLGLTWHGVTAAQ